MRRLFTSATWTNPASWDSAKQVILAYGVCAGDALPTGSEYTLQIGQLCPEGVLVTVPAGRRHPPSVSSRPVWLILNGLRGRRPLCCWLLLACPETTPAQSSTQVHEAEHDRNLPEQPHCGT